MYFIKCGLIGITIIPMVLCAIPALYDMSKVTPTYCSDCKSFSTKNYSRFSVLLEEKNSPNFFVGVRDAVLKLTMDGQLKYTIPIPLGPSDIRKCREKERNTKTLDDYNCGTMIDWIIPYKGTTTVLACGLTSFDLAVHCWRVNETFVGPPDIYTFYTNPKRVSIVSDPYVFQSWTLLTMKQPGIIQRANIYSVDKDKIELEFENDDSNFVSAYEFGNYIYYFFSDLSEEYDDASSRVIYARIGRLCKYDKGGKEFTPAQYRFQTFSKARLICSTSTDNEAFHYNHIELTSAITGDDGEVYVYALFRASKPAADRLAICRYSLPEIERAFSDRTYYDKFSTWKVVTAGKNDARHKECNPSIDTRATTFDEYKANKAYLLHVSVVHPDGRRPVTVRSHGKVSHMLADTTRIADKSYDILRLFDSDLLYELFVPTSFFTDPKVTRPVTVRKINKEKLIINDVALIKYNGSEDSPSSSPPAATTPAVSSSSTPGQPTSTQSRTTLGPSNSTSTTMRNLTHSTMSGNQSSTSPKSTIIPSTKSPSRLRSAEDTTSSGSSDPRNRFIGQERIVAATNKKLLLIPVASCGAYTSCRDCVAAMNPYCAWYNDNCVQLKKTGNKGYKQDLKDGNYAKVCPPVDVACQVKVSKLIPRAEVALECSSSGLPTPHVPTWEKDENPLTNSSFKSITINGRELKMHSYTLKNVGKYTCRMTNGVTSDICSAVIPGSSPKIKIKVARDGKNFTLKCNATGYPHPTVMVKVGDKQEAGITVEVKKGLTYQFIAHNGFGCTVGGVYQIISKTLEFRVNGKQWSADLLDPKSQKYTELAKQISEGLEKIYENDSFFLDANIKFRQGSVIATVEISGLKTPTHDENDLTRKVEEAINDKNFTFGNLGVSGVDKQANSDQTSTPTLARSPSTKEVTSRPSPAGKQTSLPTSLRASLSSIRLPASTPMPSTRKPTLSSRPVVHYVGTESVAHKSSSSGVPLWLLFVLLILIGLIVFVAGYFLGVRGVSCSKFYGRIRRSTKDSCSEEDGAEMKEGMSRSEKTRESERMLLKKHDGKKNKSPSKTHSPSKNNHLNDNISQEGSIEIKHNSNRDGDSRPSSGHSVC